MTSPRNGHDSAHDHSHDLRVLSQKRLRIALAINAVFLLVEVAGGIVSNSLALLADAGHMLTDVAALVLALIVARLAERSPTPRYTYGLLRAEVLGAFLNGAALVLVVGVVLIEAWRRLGGVPEIDGSLMLAVAVLGLAANTGSAWVLFGSRNHSVNTKGAFLHMVADALGSTGAIVAGIVVLSTGWTPIDPIVSVIIGALILWSGWGLISETILILLEGTPGDIDYHEVKRALESIEHVAGVSDLHIWTIGSGVPSLSAHIRLDPSCSETRHWQICLRTARDLLEKRFNIRHSTLQVEPEGFPCDHDGV